MAGGPLPEKTITTKLRENLAYLRSVGASREEIQGEIGRAKAAMDAKTAEERKLSGLETAGAVASKIGSGATFGLLDEAVGLFDEDAKNEQRFLQKQLQEENPVAAIGAEILGGLAVPGAIFKAPGRIKQGATLLQRVRHGLNKAGTVLAEGAVQGGISGVGNAEGSLEERLGAGAEGAAIGSVLAGGVAGVGRGIQAARRAAANARGVQTPALEDLIHSIPREEVSVANEAFGRAAGRGLGDEMMLADALPSGEGLLRSQRTANKATAKTIDSELRSRSNRLANAADDRRSLHTGTQPKSAEKTLDELVSEAKRKGEPHYAKGREEAAAFDAANPPPDPIADGMSESGARMVDLDAPAAAAPDPRAFLGEVVGLPYVRREIARLKADPRSAFKGVPDDDHNLLARVYQNLGADIRDPGLSRADRRDFIQQRTRLGEAIGQRAESWLKGNEEFAGEMALKDAYEMGAREAPSDVIPGELSELTQSERAMYKEAKAQQGRPSIPNADLGEFARFSDVLGPVGSREKAEVFKATFGEDAYREYLADLLEMAKMQKMRAGAGQSETVDKLIEQIQSGGNPDLMGMAMDLARGNVGGAARRIPFLSSAIDRLMTSSKNANENAQWLMQRGGDVPRTLDEIVRTQAAGQRPARPPRLAGDFQPSLDMVKDAAAREGGAVVGRRRR